MNEQEDPRRPGRLLGKSWIRLHIAVLRALLGDAMEEGVIRFNPAAGVRVTGPEGDGTARPRSAEKRAMTIDELPRVVAEIPPRWKLLFALWPTPACASARSASCAGAATSS
jgi:hypothetical protein